jgi:integrase
MKAGRPLLVPLARPVVELLTARRAAFPEARYVFPSDRPEGFRAPPQKGPERVFRAAGVQGVTLHDLRRSMATWAQDAGAPLEVIGRLLGHTPQGGVTSVYARVPFETLRRWVEATVANMRAVVDAEEGKVLRFPGSAQVAR